MTVKELVEQLQKMPQDLPVAMYDGDDNCYHGIGWPEIIAAWNHPGWSVWDAERDEKTEAESTPIVVL